MQLFHAELRAAIGQGDRCALCRLVADADRNHMRSFLREHGSDPMVLEPIYAAWGFCAWHAWVLALMEDSERGGVLAMALLADDLLRHLATITDASESTPLPMPSSPGPGLSTSCEMCRAMREEEQYWVKHLTDPHAYSADHLTELPRFCEPHLHILVEASEKHVGLHGWQDVWWRFTPHRAPVRRASQLTQLTHDAVALLPLVDDTDNVYEAVARACGVRELTSRVSRTGDALAPLDDTPRRTSDSDSVKCVVCAAEISAAHAACARLLTERGAAGIALPGASRLCHGHQWLLADMAASTGIANASQRDAVTPTFAAESTCIICRACRDAATETFRALTNNTATAEGDNGCLCLAHWSGAERIFSESSHEAERLRMRHAQRRHLEAAREDLRRYLDYFSVSTRDPDAPSPGTFAWRQALTLLVGMRPQGQCRARGDQ